MGIKHWKELKLRDEIVQEPWEFSELLREIYEVCGEGFRLLEIGSHKGGTALGFVRECNARVTCIDVTVQPELQALADAYPDSFRILQGNSHDPEIVAKAEELRFVSVLFIDGDHSAEGSMRDFLDYQDLVIPGGLVVFHDIVESEIFKRHNIRVDVTWKELKTKYRHKEITANADPINGEMGIGILYL